MVRMLPHETGPTLTTGQQWTEASGSMRPTKQHRSFLPLPSQHPAVGTYGSACRDTLQPPAPVIYRILTCSTNNQPVPQLETHRPDGLLLYLLHGRLHSPRDGGLRLGQPSQVHRQHMSHLRRAVSPPGPIPYTQSLTHTSPLYELSNYYVLGRILYYVPYLSPLHPGRVLTTFSFISCIVEVLNGTGASYSANTSLPQDKQNLGHNLFKAALLIQIVVIAAFLALAITFHRRCRRRGINSPTLYKALRTLYLSEALLTVRTIYRVVEYWSIAQLHFGPELDPTSLSPLVRYEWFFYVFEASLMLANQVLLNARHPRMFLPKSTKTYLATDGVTEVTGPGYDDKRPFLVTLFDPFGVAGMIKGRKKEERFWEGGATAEVVGGKGDGGRKTARTGSEVV